jgi:signal peptidase II
VVLADQLTKLWAVSALAGEPPYRFMGEFVMFTLVYNYGGAMGTSLGSSTWYLVVAFLLLPFLAFYIYHYRDWPRHSWPLAFIAGGAVGNIIDRLRLGKVIDFIDIDFFNIQLGSFQLQRWWTFNVADAAISLAIIYLIIISLFFGSHTEASGVSKGDSPATSDT